MKAVSSADIYNGPQLYASNVPENDHPVWVAGSYAKGARVILNARIYESLQASNSTEPPDGVNTDPKTWALAGVPNKWRMFDVLRRSTLQTERAENIEVTVQPYEVVNGLCLFGLDAHTVSVTMTDNGVELGYPLVVYDKTFSLRRTQHITDWYLWFTQYPDNDSRLVVLDLPVQSSPFLTVVIEKPGSTAKCGKFIVGRQTNYGKTKKKPKATLIQTSKRTRDYFGELVWKKGSVYREVTYQIQVPTGRLDYIERQLMQTMQDPTVFIGSEKYLSTAIFGAVRGSPGDVLMDKYSLINFTVEEI